MSCLLLSKKPITTTKNSALDHAHALLPEVLKMNTDGESKGEDGAKHELSLTMCQFKFIYP